MGKITRRYPTDSDAQALIKNMRPSDAEEMAVFGLSAALAVELSIDNSDPAFLWAYHFDNHLLCICGCTKSGNPWLLATSAIDKHLISLTKEAAKGVAEMLKKYPLLYNMIDSRQEKTIKWLESIGFTMTHSQELESGHATICFKMAAP